MRHNYAGFFLCRDSSGKYYPHLLPLFFVQNKPANYLNVAERKAPQDLRLKF